MRRFATSHFQAARRALRRFGWHSAGAWLSALAIGVALAVPLGLYVLVDNSVRAFSQLDADAHLNLFLKLDTSAEQVKALESRLRAHVAVERVRFISRESALADLRARAGDLVAGIEGNPLPHVLHVRPKSHDAAAIAKLKSETGAWPQVERVVADYEWAAQLARFGRFAGNLVWLLSVVLGAAAVLVTGNTIRLQILTQQAEIEVSQLMGATRRFIRRPFLYFGALQGVLAGIVAVLLVSACLLWVGQEVSALTTSYGTDFSLVMLSFTQAAGFVALAGLLGWLGAFISVTMYLTRFNPD